MYDSQRTSGESIPVWDLSPRATPDSSTSHEVSTAIETRSAGRLAELAACPQDVIIVGAGIAGLSTAYALLDAGRSVVVLDRGELGCGETGRSTAHISNALDDHYFVLERIHGPEGARLAAASHTAAIESIAAITAREGIACGFARVDGYLFGAHATRRDRELLHRELSAARRAGIDAELLRAAPLPFAAGPALRFRRQAQFDPLAYIKGLADAIQRRGGQIVTHARVLEVEDGTTVQVHCESGAILKGRAAVIATNTPFVDRFAMHTKQAPYRSYAIAVSIPKGSVERALYWDTEDPYHYIRLAGDDDLLIVGGEDHKVGQSKTPEHSWQRLEEWTRSRFADAATTCARWSGQVWEPADCLAFIGRNPGAENVLIATGDSGNGITHGAIAGVVLSDLLCARENPLARLYDPSRLVTNPSAAKEFLKENLNVALSYGGLLDGLLHRECNAEPLAPGSGAVVSRGGRRIAVYVDEAGRRHECAAVCQHLGGPVHWNHAERSWDCPCHGARYDPYGRVITGPAVRDLERIEPEAARHPYDRSVAE